MLLLVLFILGTQVGSFLNVCIWRLPRGESVVQPPSHCPNCNTRLRALDLIPLLSQFYLRGRCRYCGMKFSWRYFNIELLTGILFLLVGLQPGYLEGHWWTAFWVGDTVRLLRDLIFMSTLVVIFWIDYDTRLIQLEAVLLLGLAGIVYEAWRAYNGQAMLTQGEFLGFTLLPAPLPESLWSMVVTGSGLWLLREGFSMLYGKEALGFGDVMLVAGITANLGWNATIFTFFFLSVVVGATIGVLLQIPRAISAYRWAKRRQAKYAGNVTPASRLARHAFRKAIPFGPMLAVGAVIALLYGQRINEAYVKWGTPPPNVSSVQLR